MEKRQFQKQLEVAASNFKERLGLLNIIWHKGFQWKRPLSVYILRKHRQCRQVRLKITDLTSADCDIDRIGLQAKQRSFAWNIYLVKNKRAYEVGANYHHSNVRPTIAHLSKPKLIFLSSSRQWNSFYVLQIKIYGAEAKNNGKKQGS